MANFFTDNDDIQFLFDQFDLASIAKMREDGFKLAEEFDFAPEDADDAVDNYRRILDTIGDLSANVIDPTSEETDEIGNILNDDGSVTYTPGINEAVERMSQAELMGFTLPYRFGGLNCPNLVYTISNDIVSRADASLMNIYGLQGIAETIEAFGDEELKQEYLPSMADGSKTGAMVLTEPDAGSDLQAVKCRAYQDDHGFWWVQGVKRFITNGCGEVLLVLARTEPEIEDGRGLSLLLVENGPQVKVRRLEHKLGINGSPTCELFFDDAPAQLIGERQRGLITYVMSLMNGARVGIAAQSLGISEAAYRVARDYGDSRVQFGVSIDKLPAVRELLINMSVDIQAARVLTYFAAYNVDLEHCSLRKIENENTPADVAKKLKKDARKYKRYNGMLTPMSKYYASEMSMRVTNDAMSVLGGSGYMKDYPVERHLRDARITTIYEGTSQLQVVAAVRGVVSGMAKSVIENILNENSFNENVQPLVQKVRDGLAMLDEAVTYTKEQGGTEYMELYGRKLVDIGCYLITAALFCQHANVSEIKLTVAKRWLAEKLPEIYMKKEMICSGDRQVMSDFETLAGPLPVLD